MLPIHLAAQAEGALKSSYSLEFLGINVLNEKERGPGDAPSIGIILCAEKDNLEVEFALKSKTNPIGVAEYQLRTALPKDMRGKLPTAKQLEEAIRPALPNRGQ